MRYMGSKRKFVNSFVPMFQKIIKDNNITTYIEPFCGGRAIIKNIACPNRFAYDKSDTLIALLQCARDNFEAIPMEFSDEIWEIGKAYKKDVPQLQGIEFGCQNYWELPDTKDCLIYIDSPYQGTKTYAYKKDSEFDYIKFWDWVRELSKSNWVLVSEQNAPDDFECIWRQETNRTVGLNNKHKATEKLFRYKGGRK